LLLLVVDTFSVDGGGVVVVDGGLGVVVVVGALVFGVVGLSFDFAAATSIGVATSLGFTSTAAFFTSSSTTTTAASTPFSSTTGLAFSTGLLGGGVVALFSAALSLPTDLTDFDDAPSVVATPTPPSSSTPPPPAAATTTLFFALLSTLDRFASSSTLARLPSAVEGGGDATRRCALVDCGG
jgi:hypothetical protein